MIAVLITLSVVLTASVIFPGITAGQIVAICATCAAVSVLGGLLMLVRRRRIRVALAVAPGSGFVPGLSRADRDDWRMPPLSELTAPVLSRGRKLGLTALWVYLLIALVMVIVKVVLIALH